MRKLKRFRSWIALVAAASWNYLRQPGTARSAPAEDGPVNAKAQASSSATVAAEQASRPAAKPTVAPVVAAMKPVAVPATETKSTPKPAATPAITVESRPVVKNNGTPATAKPVDVPTKLPTVKVTVDAAPANGNARAGTMNDQSAQRLARVLISEIKLYYMSKMEGQDVTELRNIYDLLKDPIDKSRRHYKQRLGAEACASMPDYFHGELVRALCAGDESRLGPNYHAN
ncbi:MAG TPA: hypothetical protein VLA93_09475 [Pyrinomonadaceae bacterium]|nr:hypothetical protein [Pyrinomonadaceae bacterium]